MWRPREPAGLQAMLDPAAAAAGLLLAHSAGFASHDTDTAGLTNTRLWLLAALALCLQYAAVVTLRRHLGRARFGSFEELSGLLAAVAVTTGGVAVTNLLINVLTEPPRTVPAIVPIVGGLLGLALMCATRYGWLRAHERLRRPGPAAEPLVVFGAGEGGSQVVSVLLRHPTSPYRPVALLDDDPATWNRQLSGVRVRGDRHCIEAVAKSLGAGTLLIAVPSADAALLRDVTARAEAAGLTVKVLPAVGDLLDGRVGVGDIRDIDLADLLGRHQIDTDLASIAGYLTGKRVLVTGAGGSIGAELCRQVHAFAPAELMMLDRDESALHAVQLSIEGRARLDSPEVILADIRDREHLGDVFALRRPEVVFHAAALKHLTMLEQYPGEAVKTNIWGTVNVLAAAAAVGVETFVNISTDKAADPISVLGYSKRIAERLTAHSAATASGTFLSVRFGNVLGSRGSVLTTFATQIAAGGPVTVTSPDVTRYFMTVQEAVQLVIQAGAIGRRGEALVLDMGQPVSIDDVARRLAAQSPRPMDIVYTGLRPGEKLHEDLLAADEADVRPVHPLISHTVVPPLDPAVVRQLDPWASIGVLLDRMRDLGSSDWERSAAKACR